jgi:hypothetical protein
MCNLVNGHTSFAFNNQSRAGCHCEQSGCLQYYVVLRIILAGIAKVVEKKSS